MAAAVRSSVRSSGQKRRLRIIGGFVVILLIVDFMLLPVSKTRGFSIVGSYRDRATSWGLGPTFKNYVSWSRRFRFYASELDDGNWVFTGDRNGVYDRTISIANSDIPWGFWSPSFSSPPFARVITNSRMILAPSWESNFVDQTFAHIHRTYGEESAEAFRAVATGRELEGLLRWPALAHDAIVLVLLHIGLLCGTKLLYSARADRRIRRGLCPKCRYDLAGVPADTCPECGPLNVASLG